MMKENNNRKFTNEWFEKVAKEEKSLIDQDVFGKLNPELSAKFEQLRKRYEEALKKKHKRRK